MKRGRLTSVATRKPMQIAVVAGLAHAVVVLWGRSALGIYTPVFDLFFPWAFIGLTLVGGVVTYSILEMRLYSPAIGVGVLLGWAVLSQWYYLRGLDGAVWATAPQPLYFYITLWPLPLLVCFLLARLERIGRDRLRMRRDSTVD
ncbi:hypothetical protein ACFQH3_01940 [Haladaptatus sp. GCM10025707]|uniref:hypothetical protein n=1 Tax=unclassified Haladaptatus TaxID=2622732 RepID=UPI0023E7EEB8|nr:MULTISPECIES: hypothetical protein [unclassified Haladaptatus]